MSPIEQAELALSEARRAHGRLQAALEELKEQEAAELSPKGFACVVERDSSGVVLTVRMKHANLSLPLPSHRARELASLLLVQSETGRDDDPASTRLSPPRTDRRNE